MIQKAVFIPHALLILNLFTTAPASATDIHTASPQSGKALTGALLPGLSRPTLQGQMSAFAESDRRPDARFLLHAVYQEPAAKDALAEPPMVDNLLRFRF